VATSEKFVQVVPVQRWTWYSVTPTLSVEAVQERSILAGLTAEAIRFVGAVGAVASLVVALAMFEYPLKFPTASLARTR
jgi:hypothetical protein